MFQFSVQITAGRHAIKNAVVLVTLLITSPVLIFWAWLLIVPARVAFLCPEGCWCDPGGNIIDCFNSSLNNIPIIFLKDVRILYLNHTNLTSLWKDSFLSSRLTQLETLDIDNCGLVRIEPGAFNGLIMLEELSIKNNKIREIEQQTFENLTNLELLYLGKNEIENLERDAFLGLTNLRDIWLITNKIHYLLPDTFLGLNNLSHIRLNDNKIQYLHPDLFVRVSSLSSLHLQNNPMMNIPTDRHFINSPSLRELYISNCNISSIPVETFANVSGLELLDLSRNHLKDIDVNILTILPQLSTFYIYGNPLQCECQLQEVWGWCQNHSITTGHIIQPVCDSPSEVKGMWWAVLQHSQCLHDNISFHGDHKYVRYKYTDGDLVRFVHEYIDRDYIRHPPQYTDEIKYDMPAYVKFVHFLTYVQTSVNAVLFTFGAAGNVIILIIIVCNREMHTVPNIYIINLAISDLISLITNLPLAHIYMISDEWSHSEFLCKFFEFSRRVSIGLSAYSVALLSFQRYKATVNPIQSRVHSPVNWRVTTATIYGVWFLASLFALPSALLAKFGDKVMFVFMGTYYAKLILFELLAFCILPLCVIVFFYVMTARHLVKSAIPISEEIQHPQANRRKNTAKIVLGLCIVFVISYVPYHSISVIAIFNNYVNMESVYIHCISTWLLVSNSCLNPVALCCSSLAFRSQFKRWLMCFKRRAVVTTTQELTEAT
jgi:hypothetical protein